MPRAFLLGRSALAIEDHLREQPGGELVALRGPVAIVPPVKQVAGARLLAEGRLHGEEGDALLRAELREPAVREVEVPAPPAHGRVRLEEEREPLLRSEDARGSRGRRDQV